MEKKIRTCDACNKVIPDKFYKVEIDRKTKNDGLEAIVLYADLCEDCFKAMITNLQRSIRK